MKFIEFTTKVSKFPIFFIFDNIVPILNTFGKFTSIRITIGSGLKNLGTDSVSKRYQTTLFAQLSKTLLVKTQISTSFVQCLVFKKLQAKSLDIEYTFQRKVFERLRGLLLCKHSITTKLGVQ